MSIFGSHKDNTKLDRRKTLISTPTNLLLIQIVEVLLHIVKILCKTRKNDWS